ncbi:MAG: isoprenylcysteine carboxylmethyltransferase family protein [Clostridia bacterium]|nr:isoprenylcysteine carboxylmethyltransferase family protein [Clostridia bacterium]
MEIKNIVSLGLLLIYLFAFILKLVMLSNKNKVNAFVLGNKNKDVKTNKVEMAVKLSTFIWIIVWFTEAMGGVGFLGKVKASGNIISDILGLLLISFGVAFFILAMIHMRNSWRVGIDKDTKSSLVTDGVYQYSRNPAFVGMYAMLSGLLLAYPDVLTLLTAVINIISIHQLVLKEEKHLTDSFGDEYLQYESRTPRYLWFK